MQFLVLHAALGWISKSKTIKTSLLVLVGTVVGRIVLHFLPLYLLHSMVVIEVRRRLNIELGIVLDAVSM